ncbi:MAG: hypothetical protein ACXVFQ_23880 [Solirubrobacteraceae bacterium]
MAVNHVQATTVNSWRTPIGRYGRCALAHPVPTIYSASMTTACGARGMEPGIEVRASSVLAVAAAVERIS